MSDNRFLSSAQDYFEERKRFLVSELFILRPKFEELSKKTFQLQRRIEQLERELRHLENISDPCLFK